MSYIIDIPAYNLDKKMTRKMMKAKMVIRELKGSGAYLGYPSKAKAIYHTFDMAVTLCEYYSMSKRMGPRYHLALHQLLEYISEM